MTDEEKKCYVARRLGLSYMLFSLAYSYVEDCNDIIDDLGVLAKKIKVKSNNLMQSFEAYDNVMSPLFKDMDSDTLITGFDAFKEKCDELL